MFKPEISTYSKTSFLKAFCPLELKMKTLFSSLETIFFIIRQRAEKARINVSQAVGVPPTLQCLLIDSTKLPTQWGMDRKIIQRPSIFADPMGKFLPIKLETQQNYFDPMGNFHIKKQCKKHVTFVRLKSKKIVINGNLDLIYRNIPTPK